VLGIGVNLGISNTEDYPSTGLPDITNSVTLERFTDLIDTAVSSQFETGILIPPRPNQKNVVWSLMTNHLSRGLSLIQDGEKLTVKSISHGGELICHDGRKRRIISDSHNIIWN
jgi:hypothetical protein